MKQPREDISGSPLSDDLLSLDERAIAHRDALISMAKLLHTACLVGNAAPVVTRMYDRMKEPRPGDLVVERTSAMYSRNPDDKLKGFGILIETRTEWASSDEEWAAQLAEEAVLVEDDRSTVTAWYIQYGPAPVDVCRWTNCEFIALPYKDDFRPSPKEPDALDTRPDRVHPRSASPWMT